MSVGGLLSLGKFRQNFTKIMVERIKVLIARKEGVATEGAVTGEFETKITAIEQE